MFFVQSRRHEKYLYSILQKLPMVASHLLDQDEMKIHCRRPHKTSFLQILVPIGLVDSKEMIYMWNVDNEGNEGQLLTNS